MHNHKIKGWILTGSNPELYNLSIDSNTIFSSKPSALISSLEIRENNHFATMMQSFKSDKYKGKRVEFSFYFKTENVDSCSAFFCINDNMENIVKWGDLNKNEIKGSNDWGKYSIVLDVPINSISIDIGFILYGEGKLWINTAQLSEVTNKYSSTHTNGRPNLSTKPINLNFCE
ncbi:hypothetical protein [Cytobacillus sp. FSL K6-0265]|uniref:hypothetical protein n=1 Tax=Cytobacillus sp. FSL K6-0265 TaxID=2921448 RepID=UPI0030F66D11